MKETNIITVLLCFFLSFERYKNNKTDRRTERRTVATMLFGVFHNGMQQRICRMFEISLKNFSTAFVWKSKYKKSLRKSNILSNYANNFFIWCPQKKRHNKRTNEKENNFLSMIKKGKSFEYQMLYHLLVEISFNWGNYNQNSTTNFVYRNADDVEAWCAAAVING